MNTGFLGPAVATVLTVYGIETIYGIGFGNGSFDCVATVLTVYGIETVLIEKELEILEKLQQYLPFTVLKPKKDLAATEIFNSLQQYLPFTVLKQKVSPKDAVILVATVLTVYGIETLVRFYSINLKKSSLQQYLPFTVLKPSKTIRITSNDPSVATVLTVYGIETY